MKILIPAYTGLGNFILKTPMIKKIKELYPESKIDILAGNNFGTEFVLKESNLINQTIILKEKSSFFEKLKFIFKMKKKKYDLVLLPFDSSTRFLNLSAWFISKVIVRHFYIPNTLKSKIRFLIMLLLPKIKIVPILQGRHEIDLNFDLLEVYYNKPFKREYNTFLSFTKYVSILKKFNIKAKEYIVIQIGGANGKKSAKKWDIKNFERLIFRINRELDLDVVIVGDKGDYINDISVLDNKNLKFINTAGLTTIDEVANILYYSILVLAHDSGIMHMAHALKCKLIALYGPTDYTRTMPLGNNVKIIYSFNKYFAAMYNFKANEFELPYPKSMNAISVDEVFNSIKEVMYDKQAKI